MKCKVCRLNWQGNAGRSEYGKILPGEQPVKFFRISGPRRRISHGHLQRDPTFKKVRFEKTDTEILGKVSIDKKMFSLNELNFLILVKFIRNWHH